jgi:hypothetical protein
MEMNLEELKQRLVSLQAEWDKWFANPFGDEQADKVWRNITYVKQKIEKLELAQ